MKRKKLLYCPACGSAHLLVGMYIPANTTEFNTEVQCIECKLFFKATCEINIIKHSNKKLRKLKEREEYINSFKRKIRS